MFLRGGPSDDESPTSRSEVSNEPTERGPVTVSSIDNVALGSYRGIQEKMQGLHTGFVAMHTYLVVIECLVFLDIVDRRG